MLIHSASQLLSLSGGPQRGTALGQLGIIPNGAVLVREGQIRDCADYNQLGYRFGANLLRTINKVDQVIPIRETD